MQPDETPRIVPVVPRWRRPLLIGIALVVAAWAVFGCLVVIDPTINRLQHADAVFVLGGPDVDGRAAYGLELAAQGYAKTVAISVVDPRQSSVYRQCTDGVPGLTVLCFPPDPATTQGEARQLRAYAKQYGWRSVIVVTSSYHISRARWILDRCFSGNLIMRDAPAHHGPVELVGETFYQGFAYVKNGLFTTGC